MLVSLNQNFFFNFLFKKLNGKRSGRKIVMQIVFETINIYFKNRGIFFSKYSSSSDYSKLFVPRGRTHLVRRRRSDGIKFERSFFLFIFRRPKSLSLSLPLEDRLNGTNNDAGYESRERGTIFHALKLRAAGSRSFYNGTCRDVIKRDAPRDY